MELKQTGSASRKHPGIIFRNIHQIRDVVSTVCVRQQPHALLLYDSSNIFCTEEKEIFSQTSQLFSADTLKPDERERESQCSHLIRWLKRLIL